MSLDISMWKIFILDSNDRMIKSTKKILIKQV
jgi:hypothetical protein